MVRGPQHRPSNERRLVTAPEELSRIRTDRTNHKRMKHIAKVLLVFGIIALTALIGFEVFIHFKYRQPVETVERFLTGTKQEDIAMVLSCLSGVSEWNENAFLYKTFKDYKNFKVTGFASISPERIAQVRRATSIEGIPKTVGVWVEITHPDDGASQYSFYVERGDETWKISHYLFSGLKKLPGGRAMEDTLKEANSK